MWLDFCTQIQANKTLDFHWRRKTTGNWTAQKNSTPQINPARSLCNVPLTQI